MRSHSSPAQRDGGPPKPKLGVSTTGDPISLQQRFCTSAGPAQEANVVEATAQNFFDLLRSTLIYCWAWGWFYGSCRIGFHLGMVGAGLQLAVQSRKRRNLA